MSGALIQGAIDLLLMSFYTASGTGATGLTVTVDVWRYRAAAWSEVIAGGSATHVGDGLYNYLLASSNVAAGDVFAAVFKTTGTADQKHVAGQIFIETNYTTTISGRVDAAITTRASQATLDTLDDYVDTEVAAIKAKTDNLPASPAAVGSAMTLAADSITSTVLATSAVNEIVDQVWDETATDHSTTGTTGKLLQTINTNLGAASVTITSPVTTDGEISIIIGDDYLNTDGRAVTINYTSVPSLTAATPVRIYILDPALGAANFFSVDVVDADTLRLELTDTQTGTLKAGTFDYYIRATLSNGDIITLTQSSITIDDPTT